MTRFAQAMALVLAPVVSAANPGDTELISVGLDGTAAEGQLQGMSADGRYVMFMSYGEIVPTASNGTPHLYVRDRTTASSVRVTLSTTGAQPNSANTGNGVLSPSGRYAAFASDATNLVPGVTGGLNEVYLRDIVAGTLEHISKSTAGVPANDLSFPTSISADGRYVVFSSDAANLVTGITTRGTRIYVRDRTGGETRLVSSNVGPCWNGRISADGRYVLFGCGPPISSEDATNIEDVYLRDLATGALELISKSTTGAQGNDGSYASDVSADGRFVVFWSFASNLVTGDTNSAPDAFLRDRAQGTLERVSLSSTGVQANGNSWAGHVTPDGRYVVFHSDATNFVTGDVAWADVFVRDRQLGTTTIATVDSSGALGGTVEVSDVYFISDDGQRVSFATRADWAANDTNGFMDVYLHEMGGTTPPPPSGTVAFTVKPAELDFGAVPVSTTVTKSLWLRNKADTPLRITKISLRGTHVAQFRLASTCASTVSPGASCAIRVTFAPTSGGLKSAKVRVDAGGKVRINPVAGVGVP